MDDDAAPDLRHYLAILRRRKILVVLVTLLVTLLAVGLSVRQKPVYEASSQVLLESQSVDPVAEKSTNTPAAERRLKNEVRQLESTGVRAAVDEAYHGPLPVAIVKGSVADLDSDVIQVSATGGDPEEVANLVNTYVSTYLTLRPQQQVAALLETGKAVSQKVDELKKRLNDVEAPLTALDAQIAAATPDSPPPAPPGKPPNTVPASVLNRLNDLQRERNVKFEEASPQLTQLKAQLAYYQDQLDKVQLSAGIRQAGDLRLLVGATPPTTPVSPKPVRNGVLGFVIGCLLGAGLALARDHLDDALRDKETLEADSMLPTLGVIPRFRTRHGKELREVVTLTEPSAPASEAYRTLRTSVKVLGLDGDCRVLQLTSANASEGKTLTALNLAVTLTQAGDRTIIVGCDLRRPRLDSLAHAHEGPGLTSVLVGDAKLHEAIERHEDLDLSILRTGPIPSDPSELLGSNRAGALIQALRGAYDVVILDCPPLLPVSDSLILAAYSDATLLVVSEGVTSRRALARALELLRQVNAPLRGTVLNGSRAAEVYGYGRYAYAQSEGPSGRSKLRPPSANGDRPVEPVEPVDQDEVLVEP